MYFALQALRTHLQRIAEARVLLLNLRIEICTLVHGYSGTFVLEDPWDARALPGEGRDVGLQRPVSLKKRTGWTTNNKHVYETMNIRCDRTHPNELIFGGDHRGSRSMQAQHYTPELVKAVLEDYAASLQTRQKIEVRIVEAFLRRRRELHYVFEENTALNEIIQPASGLRGVHLDRRLDGGRAGERGGEVYRLLPPGQSS